MFRTVLTILLVLAVCPLVFAQNNWIEIENPGWEFTEVFDSTAGAGAQGIVRDGEGKIWVAGYRNYIQIRNMDGTPATFSPIDTVIIADSAYSIYLARGIDALPDGNIIVTIDKLVLKFDHLTGELLAHYDMDEAFGSGITASPAVDDNGRVYVPRTIGVSPITVLDSDLNYLREIDIDGTTTICRDIEVNDTGTMLYITNNSSQFSGGFHGPVHIFESTDLVNYEKTDSLFLSAEGDTIFSHSPIYANWGPNNLMWVSNDDYYGAWGAAGAVDNSLVAFNYATRQYFEVSMPDTSVVYREPSFYDGRWYFNGPRGCVFSDDGREMYVASPNMGYIYKYMNSAIEPSIHIQVENSSAAPGDSVTLPIAVTFPDSQLYSASQLTIQWDDENLALYGIDTSNTLLGNAGWTVASSQSEDLLEHWSAGAEPISGEGVFMKLLFAVTGDSDGFAPVTLDSVLFDAGNDQVSIENGGIRIVRPPMYGDADGNEIIDEADARHILNYSVNDEISIDFDAADVSLDGDLNNMDASLILQYVHNVIDTLPYSLTNGDYSATGDLAIEDDTIAPGTDFDMPISLSGANNIYAFKGVISYTGGMQWLTGDSLTWSTSLDSFILVMREEYGQTTVTGAHYNALETDGVLGVLHFHIHEAFGDTMTPVRISQWRWNSDSMQVNVDAANIYPYSVGLLNESSVPDKYALLQNYPNPFNPLTTIRYGLPQATNVSVIIYDIRGRQVATLTDRRHEAGWHEVRWDGTNAVGKQASTGVYFYTIRAENYRDTKKLLYLR